MPVNKHVAIFWDYENCHPPSALSGYDVANSICRVAHEFGSVKIFKAYSELSEQQPSARTLAMRSELQSSGVSLTDCPHNGRKDVADKMMIVDMLAYAIDNPPPTTFILITGDRDFAYATSILKLRRYEVVIIAPSIPAAHNSLKSQASVLFHWDAIVEARVLAGPRAPPPRNELSNVKTHSNTQSDPQRFPLSSPTQSSESLFSRSALLKPFSGSSDSDDDICYDTPSTQCSPKKCRRWSDPRSSEDPLTTSTTPGVRSEAKPSVVHKSLNSAVAPTKTSVKDVNEFACARRASISDPAVTSSPGPKKITPLIISGNPRTGLSYSSAEPSIRQEIDTRGASDPLHSRLASINEAVSESVSQLNFPSPRSNDLETSLLHSKKLSGLPSGSRPSDEINVKASSDYVRSPVQVTRATTRIEAGPTRPEHLSQEPSVSSGSALCLGANTGSASLPCPAVLPTYPSNGNSYTRSTLNWQTQARMPITSPQNLPIQAGAHRPSSTFSATNFEGVSPLAERHLLPPPVITSTSIFASSLQPSSPMVNPALISATLASQIKSVPQNPISSPYMSNLMAPPAASSASSFKAQFPTPTPMPMFKPPVSTSVLNSTSSTLPMLPPLGSNANSVGAQTRPLALSLIPSPPVSPSGFSSISCSRPFLSSAPFKGGNADAARVQGHNSTLKPVLPLPDPTFGSKATYSPRPLLASQESTIPVTQAASQLVDRPPHGIASTSSHSCPGAGKVMLGVQTQLPAAQAEPPAPQAKPPAAQVEPPAAQVEPPAAQAKPPTAGLRLESDITLASPPSTGDAASRGQICHPQEEQVSSSIVLAPATPATSIAPQFRILVDELEKYRSEGILRPTRSEVAVKLLALDKAIFKKAGVVKFRQYSILAEVAGLVEMGGQWGEAWISLSAKVSASAHVQIDA